jgi:hypothetical protein
MFRILPEKQENAAFGIEVHGSNGQKPIVRVLNKIDLLILRPPNIQLRSCL